MLKMKNKKISLTIYALLIFCLLLPIVHADVDLSSKCVYEGKYSIVAAGVGLKDVSSGDINIDIDGDVVVAYLYWSGVDYDTGDGDDSIVFDSNTIVADEESYGPEEWYNDNPNRVHYVYFADVTEFVTPGLKTYTVSGVDFDHKEYGAGLIVVYENPELPWAMVVLMDGLDGFYYDWNPDLGPNSNPVCFAFDSITSERNVQLTLFVGGTENDNRPNEVWTQTGTETEPTNIIPIEGTTIIDSPYPLVGADGSAWDTYRSIVNVPAGDEWLCVQVESVNPSNVDDWGENNEAPGTSALLIVAGFVLELPQPLDGLSPGFWKHNIRVALDYPGYYSVPHEGELRLNYDAVVALAEKATGEIGTNALAAALDALTTKGKSGSVTRLAMANALNAAAGYSEYSD